MLRQVRMLQKKSIKLSVLLYNNGIVCEVFQSDGRFGGEEDFVEFFGDAFFGDDFEAVGVADDGFVSFWNDGKIELGSESDGAEHAQWIVGEGDVWV